MNPRIFSTASRRIRLPSRRLAFAAPSQRRLASSSSDRQPSNVVRSVTRTHRPDGDSLSAPVCHSSTDICPHLSPSSTRTSPDPSRRFYSWPSSPTSSPTGAGLSSSRTRSGPSVKVGSLFLSGLMPERSPFPSSTDGARLGEIAALERRVASLTRSPIPSRRSDGKEPTIEEYERQLRGVEERLREHMLKDQDRPDSEAVEAALIGGEKKTAPWWKVW